MGLTVTKMALSFHRKVKFIIDEKVVSISREENIIAMTYIEALYVKANAKIKEFPSEPLKFLTPPLL